MVWKTLRSKHNALVGLKKTRQLINNMQWISYKLNTNAWTELNWDHTRNSYPPSIMVFIRYCSDNVRIPQGVSDFKVCEFVLASRLSYCSDRHCKIWKTPRSYSRMKTSSTKTSQSSNLNTETIAISKQGRNELCLYFEIMVYFPKAKKYEISEIIRWSVKFYVASKNSVFRDILHPAMLEG